MDPQNILLKAVELSKDRLEDPEKKNSHPHKPLLKHVEECSEVVRFISGKYGLNVQFSLAICALHDIGKLRPEWSIGIKEGHSREGAAIIEKIKEELREELGFNEGEMNLLIFMIKKHHSSLKPDNYMDFKSLSWLKEKKEACLYADSFGAFKLADFASANGTVEEMKLRFEGGWPDIESLRKLIKNLREDKWRKQVELVSNNNIDLAAPTGWGKTFVGVLKALIDRPLKLFYCLPTITAIRKMKESLERIMGEEVGEYFYFSDVDLLGDQGETVEGSNEERLLDFYRLFLPKVNLTTVDQLILTLIRAGKYHMKRLCFRDSVVVLDEYHLLPAPMIGALSKILEYYRDVYNMRIVLMTATPLGPYRRILRDSLGYVSTFDLTGEYRSLRRHKFSFIGRDEALNKLEELYKEGKRVLVIMNTVDRAIDFYKKVKGERLLLHSRFTVKDRLRKEKMIDDCRILVSTQVAEVSLDVSFDSLITEVAPIPSIIQRAGRVNRYGNKTESVNVFLVDPPHHEPYSEIELKYSRDTLYDLYKELEHGEEAVLRMLSEYEKLIRETAEREINKARGKIEELLEDHLFSKDMDEIDIVRKLRGDPSILVIPSKYEDEVRKLIEMMPRFSYLERMKIYSKIKGYLVPLKFSLAQSFMNRENNFLFPVVRDFEYSEELGLYRYAT
ncbi:MAG: CRISPR-associated helicase Cas3' [Thermoproteota archaeon]|nr:MAG: CRISPR-associated helicase Cas3' [Candidatus Korarchaeota archaeon]